MRIDRSDPADEPDDVHVARRVRSTPDDPDAAGEDRGTAVTGDGVLNSHPGCPDSALCAARAAYRAKVDAVYRQYAIDHDYAPVEKIKGETVTPAIRGIETEETESHPIDLDDRLEDKAQLAESSHLQKLETSRTLGGDIPDDPRNYSNPKTGRLDASWFTYDRAIAAAREHAGGDLGPDSIKMYDYNSEAREGTGTLIGEQTPDRLRGWRIDAQDGHVNWWDWTGGKKGAGGVYGHDWFPDDPSTPGSRYIGWAPWQDSSGNILEGN